MCLFNLLKILDKLRKNKVIIDYVRQLLSAVVF